DLAPWPLLLNMVEHGSTPLITVAEAKEMGFRIQIWPFAAIAPAYEAIRATMEKLKGEGKADCPDYITPKFVFKVCGLDESMEIDRLAGGDAYEKGS
ncbi:hypothetical protein LTS18_006940, partial [Coniosporium uncinatum]